MSSNKLLVLLGRLQGVRKTSDNQYKAKCPAHEDGKPSLSIGIKDNGKILLNCFAGCQCEDIVHGVGMRMADLMPDAMPSWGKKTGNARCSIAPGDALELATHELIVAALVIEELSTAVSQGSEVSTEIKDRVFSCASRIRKISTLATGHLTSAEIKAIRRNVVI